MGNIVKNIYEIKDDCCELYIKGGKYGNKKVFIDIDDINKAKDINWTINKYTKAEKIYYYAVGQKILMHRYLTNATSNNRNVVDHINDNTLDNRKSNLKICSDKDNLRKSTIKSNNKTGVKGVCWYKKNNKYMSYIKVNYKHITLGYHDTIEEARESRLKAEKKYFNND